MALGYHLMGTWYGCKCEDNVLINPPIKTIEDIITNAGLTVENRILSPSTNIIILSESHVSITSNLESRSAYIDIFVCHQFGDNTKKAKQVYNNIRGIYLPSKEEFLELMRGDINQIETYSNKTSA